MEIKNFYRLPSLSYDYNELEPYMSKEQLSLHHLKHHQGYVNGLNADIMKIEKARKDGSEIDLNAILKEISFNFGGHVLHTLFWDTMTPARLSTPEPKGELLNAITNEFQSFKRFKEEFTQTALHVEGSGWVALVYSRMAERLMLMQVEKHNNFVYPEQNILMLIDVFEHAYYLDYKNEKSKFVEGFWNVISWDKVEERYKEAKG